MSQGREVGWVRVTPRQPCEHCGTSNERCAESADGRYAVCYREGGPGWREKATRDGTAYFVLDREGGRDPGRGDAPRGRPRRDATRGRKGRPLASLDLRDAVYSACLGLDATALADEDRQALRARGLTDGQIEDLGYRSLTEARRAEVAPTLAARFGSAALYGVPGFYADARGLPRLACGPGLLLPSQAPDGRVQALMARPHRAIEGGPKYHWASSRKRGGPGPEAPVHVPLGIAGPAATIRITEGILKADLATAWTGVPTLGCPGVTNWRGALAVARDLGASTPRIAFDADGRTNPKVARALHDCAAAATDAGLVVEIEEWDPADGKGIDDLLKAGKEPRLLAGPAAVEARRRAAEIAGVDPTQAAPRQAEPHAGGPGESQAQALLRLASGVVAFRTPDGKAYATLPVGDHREHHPVDGASTRRWLTHAFYRERGAPPSHEALQSALNVLQARAQFDGLAEPVHVRVAGRRGPSEPDGPAVYVDLGDPSWQAVRVDREGWGVVAGPPVKFRRPRGLLPLPAPARGGSLDGLRGLLNLPPDSEGEWRLVVAWLTAAFLPEGPYPILVLEGGQGSAKTTTARLLRRCLDPHSAPLRSAPRDVRDLMIAATNSWVLGLDNLSGLPDWLSDALCRTSTGGGFATRTLYADDEETFFEATRPALLNGIEGVATRHDLLDRCLVVELPPIPEGRRRAESALGAESESALPEILGAPLDAVSGGLRELDGVELDRLPRMADFARWGEAVGRALGWSEGAFLEAYEENRRGVCLGATEDSAVALAIRGWIATEREWAGTATELLAALSSRAGGQGTRARGWPSSPRKLSGELRRSLAPLSALGVSAEFYRDPGPGRSRMIRLLSTDASPDRPSGSSGASPTAVGNPDPSEGLRVGSGADGPAKPRRPGGRTARRPSGALPGRMIMAFPDLAPANGEGTDGTDGPDGRPAATGTDGLGAGEGGGP